MLTSECGLGKEKKTEFVELHTTMDIDLKADSGYTCKTFYWINYYLYFGNKWAHAVAYLVDVLCYKSEGSEFESR
jgi:hypothetical protein